jgi:transposase
MKPYSRDLRERIIAALETSTYSQDGIETTSGVSLSFVETLWRKWRKTGDCNPLPLASACARIESPKWSIHQVYAAFGNLAIPD